MQLMQQLFDIFTAEENKIYRPRFYRVKQLCKCGQGDRNSVRPSVTRMLCDETIEHTADLSISHERDIILVF